MEANGFLVGGGGICFLSRNGSIVQMGGVQEESKHLQDGVAGWS